VGHPSIVFEHDRSALKQEPPDFFADLNFDQVVASITAGRDEYDLAPFFYTPLDDVDAVAFRHEALRDLRAAQVREHVETFARRMRIMREQLALIARLHHPLQRERWSLEAARTYRIAVGELTDGLTSVELRSRAMCRFRDFLAAYSDSEAFTALARDVEDVRAALAEVRYTLEILGLRIKVARFEEEDDYAVQVSAAFAKFKRRDARDYRMGFRDAGEMNHVEAGVLERVASLHPEAFGALSRFCDRHREYLDATVAAFDRELQFYLSVLEFTERLDAAGLRCCLPTVHAESKQVSARNAFDVALAAKLVSVGSPVVTNDFELVGDERIVVVSGPNQGGKTTFARTFGQMHHLARLGCPVPGTHASLFLCDDIFTHFEKEERLDDIRGKLQDDLLRIHDILERATSRSIVILNEIFTSTTLTDAADLGARILGRVIELDALCVCVTFVEELASLDPSVVSMVSTVDPADPAIRTFKVVRAEPGGITYAVAIAEKYGLTFERLSERIGS
jgi:DNA mismatch repair protein MutS